MLTPTLQAAANQEPRVLIGKGELRFLLLSTMECYTALVSTWTNPAITYVTEIISLS